MLSLGPIMKHIAVTIIMAVTLAISYTALDIPVAGNIVCNTEDSGTGNRTDSHTLGNTEGFHGFIAYNALSGTSERITTADRQVFVFRDPAGGSAGYNQAASKRQNTPGMRWVLENSVTHSLPARYYLLQHNVNILDRGMSSNSERIHFLRILII